MTDIINQTEEPLATYKNQTWQFLDFIGTSTWLQERPRAFPKMPHDNKINLRISFYYSSHRD